MRLRLVRNDGLVSLRCCDIVLTCCCCCCLLCILLLLTVDSDAVAKRYAKKGVLLPTVSDTPRTDYASIKDYFDTFLTMKPQGVILESHVTTGPKWCQDVGLYEFTMGATGAKVKARYTFVYVFEDGEWKIAHHHSSVMPEAGKPVAITEDEVKSLFSLWNNALATRKSVGHTTQTATSTIPVFLTFPPLFVISQLTVTLLPSDTLASPFFCLPFLILLALTTLASRITLTPSCSRNPKEKSCHPTYALATTGAKTLVFTNSPWVRLAIR